MAFEASSFEVKIGVAASAESGSSQLGLPGHSADVITEGPRNMTAVGPAFSGHTRLLLKISNSTFIQFDFIPAVGTIGN